MKTDICKNYHQGNEFSIRSRASFTVKAVRDQILRLIKNSAGLTCEEVEDTLSLKHQTASARISELKKDGLILPVDKRKTRSGCQAAVYIGKNTKPVQTELFN